MVQILHKIKIKLLPFLPFPDIKVIQKFREYDLKGKCSIEKQPELVFPKEFFFLAKVFLFVIHLVFR